MSNVEKFIYFIGYVLGASPGHPTGVRKHPDATGVGPGWKMNSVVLETKQMDEALTGENVAARLTQVADAYHIPPGKRVSVVTDNAANMVLSVELLKGSGQWPDVELVRCAGHTLQLCVNAALKEDPVSRMVAAARRLEGSQRETGAAKSS